MKRYLPSVLSVLLVGGWISTESNAQTGTPESHEAAARAAAYRPGNDFTWIFDRLCGEFSRNVINTLDPAPAAPTAAPAPRTIPPREEWYEPPAKIFDNLYYVGSYLHSMWAVTTSEGIILHDTAFDYMVEDEIVDGLRQMGLDAADIKYVIISYGHSDHYFGARTLRDMYGARIIMSEADWDLVVNDNNPPEVKPRKDMVATDGMELTLGDTTLTLYITPGHTPGTIATVISRGRCNTSHKKRGEVYGQETKEQADEEAAMVHSDRAGRGVGSLAAGGVVPIDRTRAGERGIGDSSSTGRVRGHPSAVPLPVIAGIDSGRT